MSLTVAILKGIGGIGHARSETDGARQVSGVGPAAHCIWFIVLTLDAVAAYVGFNTTYFRHLFKKEMRISFKEYLTHLRLTNARMLLLNSSLSIGSVIEEVGYSNISQFYRIFRQYYHMTPAQYRKMQLRSPMEQPDEED